MPSVSFNSGSGNWTVPAGVFSVNIELWGGGGGGSGGGDDEVYGASGKGGGGGGYCLFSGVGTTPGDTFDYSVGAGGVKGIALNDNGVFGTNGTAGGTTTFGSGSGYAYGGAGADNSVAGDTPGGTATGGTTNTTGGTGSDGGAGPIGGTGGSSPNGGAGGAANTDGTAPGGGGGGGSKNFDGGNGAAGRITFTYTVTPSTYNQTMSGGVEAGSSANVFSRNRVSMSGGIEAGSSAKVTSSNRFSVSGGIEAGSSAAISVRRTITVSGGVEAGSSAVEFVRRIIIGSGGVESGSSANVTSSNRVSMSGGIESGSSANVTSNNHVSMSGGVNAGSSAVEFLRRVRGRVSFAQFTIPESREYNETMSGGVVCGLSGVINVRYDLFPIGGIVVDAKSITIGGAQELNPNSDIDAGTWIVAPLYPKIDEIYPDDTDFISSADNPSNSTCEVKLETGLDPQVSTGHVIYYRCKKSDQDYTMGLTVRLMQGASMIAEWTHNNVPFEWTEFEQTLSTVQANSITDYSDLSVKLIANMV